MENTAWLVLFSLSLAVGQTMFKQAAKGIAGAPRLSVDRNWQRHCCGLVFVVFGAVFGLTAWLTNANGGQFISTATVILAALSIIVGAQLLPWFVGFDTASEPVSVLHHFLIGLGPAVASDHDRGELHRVGC